MTDEAVPILPRGWGTDEVTKFVEHARANAFATYANLRADYAKVTEIDRLFRRLNDNLLNTPDWFAAFFLLRAHSAFLTGSHLAMSGQTAETYAALRLCLENGLYGLYCRSIPSHGKRGCGDTIAPRRVAACGRSLRFDSCSAPCARLMARKGPWPTNCMSGASTTGRIQTNERSASA